MLTNLEFVERVKSIQKNFKTTYMWGTFGSLVSETIISQKSKQYPKWYTTNKISKLRKMVGQNVWAFDCVGIIKSILWGWNGSKNKSYGGATYASNGVPDIDADAMIARCKNVSSDFSKIKIGEVVWKKGHIGVYIGDNLVIECTTNWGSKVVISSIKSPSQYKYRSWTKHGQLPWVDYDGYIKEEEEEEMKPTPLEIEVNNRDQKILSVNVDGSNFVKLRDVAPLMGYKVEYKNGKPILVKE